MPEQSRPRDRDPPPNKRSSITDRLLGSFGQARKDTSATVQRRTSSVNKQSSPVSRIREWLDTCNSEHHHHCNVGSSDKTDTWRPIWLIDCVDKILVRAKPVDRYATLSYVWGTGPGKIPLESTAILLKSNVDAFGLSLPEDDIPQTILDAIWLCKKVGLRFLWVDRLCIVHDDEQEQETYIRNMAYVFANSYLTIVATYGDVYMGLLPLDPRRPTRAPRSGSRDHNDLLLESKWSTRGWTLQEQLYSRRAIYFFEDAVTWECHCDVWQGSTTSVMKAIRGSRHTCTNPVPPAAFGYQHPPWPDLDEYARIAADYSSRRVTMVDDTLRAFAGVTSVLSRVFPGGFVFGMPLMFLDIALLWRPSASLRRRALSRPPFLPSWSWMGWWFDGVPVDLVLWKAAADYVEETRYGKKGQVSRRFQSPSSFKIKPTVTWNLTDRSATLPVPNTGLQYRELRSRRTTSALPHGWTRSGSAFKHDSDASTTFKYPVPVEEPPEVGEYAPPAGEMAFPGPFLSFKTTTGLFEVDYGITMSPRGKPNPPIAVGNIWTKSNKWAGEFRAHDGWLGIQSSNYDGDEKLEFIAISTATERRGSQVFAPERFEENADVDGIMDIVNLLWVERIGGVCYRRGIGHILQKAWDAQAKDEVDILLG